MADTSTEVLWHTERSSYDWLTASSVLFAAERHMETESTSEDWNACGLFDSVAWRALSSEHYEFQLRSGVTLSVRGEWCCCGFKSVSAEVRRP